MSQANGECKSTLQCRKLVFLQTLRIPQHRQVKRLIHPYLSYQNKKKHAMSTHTIGNDSSIYENSKVASLSW